MSIQNVLYRFYEVGGTGASIRDIKDCIDKSDAAFYVCEQNCLASNTQNTKDLFLKTAPIIVEKDMPTVVIVNKARSMTARSQSIERLTQPYLGSIKRFYLSISKPNDQLFTVFNWLDEIISPQSKE